MTQCKSCHRTTKSTARLVGRDPDALVTRTSPQVGWAARHESATWFTLTCMDAEQTQQALTLRERGRTWADIEHTIGVPHDELVASVAAEIERRQDANKLARMLEMVRLDSMLASIWPDAETGNLEAVNLILKIMERRSKYQGLDHADTIAAARLELDARQLDLIAAALAKALDNGGMGQKERLQVVTGFIEEVRELEG